MSHPFRVAVVTTEYRPESHADVIVSRWLAPFEGDEELGWVPRTQIASIHADQIPDNDQSAELCARHGIRHCATVQEALTLGGPSLAVDAVLLIAEHGNYPLNELGQKLYPRKELFDQVAAVFREAGRAVPVFFDKHLSWNPQAAHEMYWTIKDLGIPFFGGSSLPHSPLVPALQLPTRCREIVAIYWNALEDYLFHSLEVVAAALERTGHATMDTASIAAWKDEGVWNALDEEKFSEELLNQAAEAVSGTARAAMEAFRIERGSPVYAFRLSGSDGLKTTHVMQKDIIRKWTLACGSAEPGPVRAAYVDAGGRDRNFPHFARLNRQIEDFFLTGKEPIPVERIYRTTMATAACMNALRAPGTEHPTPCLLGPIRRAFSGA